MAYQIRAGDAIKKNIPWISFGLGLLFSLLLLEYSPLNTSAGQRLPLLTSLFIAEFGFLVTADSAFVSFRTLGAERHLRSISLLIGNGLLARQDIPQH
jgi:hypothetical protein